MIRKRGQTIDSIELWERLASPKSSIQWKDHRSAKECARAWLGALGNVAIPTEVLQVLATSSDFSEITIWEAEPECLVPFDEFTGPANIDVLVTGSDTRGPFAMAVEAKADESFGSLLGDAFASALERRLANPSSKGVARLGQLAASILPPANGKVPRAQHMRYQLLTATAAALATAKSIGANRAVVMIHEFRTKATDPKKLDENQRDLTRFLDRLGFEKSEEVFTGKLVGPVTVPSGAAFAQPPRLYFGKAVRRFEAVRVMGRIPAHTGQAFRLNLATCSD